MNPEQIATTSSCAGAIFACLVKAERKEERWVWFDIGRDTKLQRWLASEKKAALDALIDAGFLYLDECGAYAPAEQHLEVSASHVAEVIRVYLISQLLRAA